MPSPIVPAQLAFTADGIPYSAEYADVYHSAAGGLGQARHVFLAGNGLPERWRGQDRFVIIETGFGLGLNFLATWQAWRDDPQRCGRLHFISFEKHPFSAADLAALHAHWPELSDLAVKLSRQWPVLMPGMHRLTFDDGQVALTLLFGDAAELLLHHALTARADAFFLDGFSPAKNPELWSPRLFKSLGQLAEPGAMLATWTVAGAVRAGLAAAGFEVARTAGYADKRQMLRGAYRGFPRQRCHPVNLAVPSRERHAMVIGAGLAGTACAERLAARGWQITLIERGSGPAQGASGNHAGVLRPLPSGDDNQLARLTRAAFLHARQHLQMLTAAGLPLRWDACGVLHLARDPLHEQRQRQIVIDQQPPADYLRFVESAEASALAQWPLTLGGWWFPSGGWVQPPSLCQANLQCHDKNIAWLFGRSAERMAYSNGRWQVFDAQDQLIAAAPVLILANAIDARLLAGESGDVPLPLRVARGQVSHLPQAATSPLEIVVCRLGYVTPAVDGIRCFGASFIADDEGLDLRNADHRENLARLDFCLPGYAKGIAPEGLAGRVGLRSMTQDRMPLIGALADAEAAITAMPGGTQLDGIPRQKGLYGLLGLGARGLVWSSLAAELLVAQIEGDPLPLESDLVAAVDPARFLLRRLRRR